MNISFDAEVVCKDGPCGRPSCLIINPINRKITHIVVQGEGFAGAKVLVPVDLIAAATEQRIELRCARQEFLWLEPFEEVHYLDEDLDEYDSYANESYMLLPYVIPLPEGPFLYTQERIPMGNLAIHRGAPVKATDGRIGRVDEFLVDPADEHITHLVMREGHLWGQKDVTIPVDRVDRLEDDTVYLKMSKHEAKDLPAVAIQRHARQQ